MGTVECCITIHGIHVSYSLFAIIEYHEFKFETGLF